MVRGGEIHRELGVNRWCAETTVLCEGLEIIVFGSTIRTTSDALFVMVSTL